MDPATVSSFPDTLIQFDGPAAGGPASAIIGPGIEFEDVAFFQARGTPNRRRLAVDIDIDAAGLVTFTGANPTAPTSLIELLAPGVANTMTLFWDLSIQTPDVLLTGASQLGQPLWSQSDFFAVVCDVSVRAAPPGCSFRVPTPRYPWASHS